MKNYLPLSKVMEATGITVGELSLELGITVDTLEEKLNGDMEWDLIEVKKVCEIFNMSAYKLFVNE